MRMNRAATSRDKKLIKRLRAKVKTLDEQLEIVHGALLKTAERELEWKSKAESYELDLHAERRRITECLEKLAGLSKLQDKYAIALNRCDAADKELEALKIAHDNLYLDFEKARAKLAIIEIVVAKPPYPRRRENSEPIGGTK